MIGKVEAFGQELQLATLSQPEGLGHPQIKVNEIRPQAGIAASANRAIIGGVAVAIHVRSRQQIEGMAAVVPENRRQLPTAQPLAFSGGFCNHCCHDFMSLIKAGKTAFRIELSVVLGPKVTVEIGNGIDGLAERVIRQKTEVVAQTLGYLDNSSLIHARPD
jgi:hypothetical protein